MRSSKYEYQIIRWNDGRYGVRWTPAGLGNGEYLTAATAKWHSLQEAKDYVLRAIETDERQPTFTVIPWEEV